MSRRSPVLLLVLLAGCGGGSASDSPTSLSRAREAVAAVETPIQRFSDALAASKPSNRTTMVTLRASASRASDALRRSITQLDEIDDQAPAADRREIAGFADALTDVRRLADEVAQGKLIAARVELATERATEAVQDGGLDLPAFSADRLVAGLRSARKTSTVVAAKTDDGGVSVPVGEDPRTSSAPGSFFTYYGPAFQAKLPEGAGWGSPAQSQPTPRELYRTSVRGPDGLFVIVDYTPYESARFGGSFTSRTTVGQTAFGSATRYVFQGGRLPECQRNPCVDYIINDAGGGGGFGVLAGGPDSAAAASLAQTVAESVVPTSGD